MISRLVERVPVWARFVKFSHSIFALPFALGMLVLCAIHYSVTLQHLGWIVVCLVAARTSAMACNRILDRDIDEQNPRTQERELPSRQMSVVEAYLLWGAATVIFLYGAYALGWHCFVLAVPVLFILCGYSYAKRFTSLSHVVLGLALALAPGGVWYAITAEWSFVPVPLMGAVLFWVAGFDILYSCQDEDFDKEAGLFSVPARFGVKNAFRLAQVFHLLAILLLFGFGSLYGLSVWYYGFCVVFAGFLIRQHTLVSPSDLSRIDAAFFTQNGLASLSFFLAACIELMIAQSV